VSIFSLIHVALGLIAVAIGFVILGLRKGDPRHRALGWGYAGCMVAALTSIIIQGLSHPTPFHGYAALITGGVVAGVLASRFRNKIGAWRCWHAALMSLSLLAAVIAIGGVVGGLALGVGKGPVYYRMFNGVIVIFTGIGLWIINTQPVIWGRQPTSQHRKVRLWFTLAVITMSGALVLAQWMTFSR
jgi:uncharacterized membrane protein